MKILFFPSDIGGGFGHISRCLTLAHEAKLRGYDCAFVLNNSKYKKVIPNDILVYVASHNIINYAVFSIIKKIVGQRSKVGPLFTEISGLDYQILRDGFLDDKIVRKKIEKYIKIVKSFNPDVMVGDTNLLAWIISQNVNIPLVQIVRYASHPETSELIWWKPEPTEMIRPYSSALFNPLLKEMGLTKIERAEELLHGDAYIVPSLPDIEPIPENEKTAFVGELAIANENVNLPYWFKQIDARFPLVYVTIGGGAGPVGNKLFFKTIVDAFINQPFRIVVSTSSKFNPKDLPKPPENISFHKWVPGRLLISKADLVAFHGGYGTMMESVSCGKPTVVFPFQTEQEGNGRRLEQLGCSLVVRLSKEEYKKIEGKWKYGDYSFFVQNRYDMTPEELFVKVSKVLNDENFHNKAKYLQTEIKKYGGAAKAIETIENLF